MDGLDGGDRICNEASGGVVFRRVADVDEMVGNTVSQVPAGFGAAYIQPPVDERGVHADDLDGRGLSQALSPLALARPRGTRQDKDREPGPRGRQAGHAWGHSA